jgi:hypothetical protein
MLKLAMFIGSDKGASASGWLEWRFDRLSVKNLANWAS